MASRADDFDAIFEEAARIAGDATDASMARQKSPEGIAKVKADLKRDIRAGIKNSAGEWIIHDRTEGGDDDA